jgi:glycosyltransferase involved in cell wall biosynthesis
MKKYKVIRTSTIAASLDILLRGQLSFLNNFFEVIAVSGLDNNLYNVKERERVAIRNVLFKRQISLINDVISLFRLYKLFLKEKPLIVHSITPKAGLLTMIAGKLANVPIRIHTFTGLVFPAKNGIMKFTLILMDKFLCFCATNVYPEGNGVRQMLIDYNITSKPLKVIANGNVNGIDIDYFNPEVYSDSFKTDFKVKLGIGRSDFVFIYVGRLVRDKGINELIKAFSNLCISYSGKSDFKVKLLLVGDYENEYDPLDCGTVSEINNNDQIIEVGFQDDVRPFFAVSNCLAFPSYREGFPNVVLQAGAMGLPSIVTDISGCNEIITDQFNGLIIPPQNVQILIDSMANMVKFQNHYSKFQANSRAHIISNYQQNFVWQSVLNEYLFLTSRLESAINYE